MSEPLGQLGLDVQDFDRGVDRALAALRKLERKGEDTSKSVGLMATAFSKFAAVLSVGAIANFAKTLVDMGGRLNDQAAAINVNVEAIQELNYAFSQSGAKVEDVSNAFVKLNQSIEMAKDGNAKTIESFHKLGVSFKQVASLSPEQILMEIANGSKNATDKVEALDAIVDLLGKSGKKLAAGLSEGEASIRSLREETTKLTADEVRRLDEIGDAWSRLINDVKTYSAEVVLAGVKTGQTFKSRVLGWIAGGNNSRISQEDWLKRHNELVFKNDGIIGPPAPPTTPINPLVAKTQSQIAEEQAKEAIANLLNEQKNREDIQDRVDEKKAAEDKMWRDAEAGTESDRRAHDMARKEELDKLARDISQNAFNESVTTALIRQRKSGDYAGSDETRIRQEYADRKRQAIRNQDEGALREINKQEQYAIDEALAAQQRTSPGQRRQQRREQDQITSDAEKQRKRDQELIRRSERGADSREIKEAKDREDQRNKINANVDKAKLDAQKVTGFTKQDSEYLKKMVEYLTPEK